MNRYIILCFITLLVLLLISGCSTDKIEQVRIYEMESYTVTKKNSLKTVKDSRDITIIKTAINGSSKNLGIAEMVDPNYKIELGKETYYLWINKDYGKLINLNDTHTSYSLSEQSAKEVNDVILNYFDKSIK